MCFSQSFIPNQSINFLNLADVALMSARTEERKRDTVLQLFFFISSNKGTKTGPNAT